MRTKRLVAIVAASIVVAAASSQAGTNTPGPDHPQHPCVGSWDTILTFGEGGPPPVNALVTIHADGTVLESDDGPPTPHLFTAGHGAWRAEGPRECLVTYRQINFDEAANLTGFFKARVKFRVNRTGTSIGGPVAGDFYDALGNFLFGGPATIRGTRILPEPLD